MYVSYKGGISSRAGTLFVGESKQTGRDVPPRVLPFQFSLEQGLVLEFGDHYMRVVSNGAFVTEAPVGIGGVTRADPAVLNYGTQGAATAAAVNNAAVTFSYAPGDLVTVAGGVVLSPAILSIDTSELVTILANARGTGYAVNDTITLAGGTSTTSAIVTVNTVQSVSASGTITFALNPADGDTITLNGTVWTFKNPPLSTATQTQIQASLAQTLGRLASDLNASSDVQVVKCTYTASATQLSIVFDTPGTGGNAFTLAASAATPSAGTLAGGSATGVGNVTVSTAGVFTAIPADGTMTQGATSAGGTGATFQTAVFGPHDVSISNPGAYSTVPVNPVAQATTTGIGSGATFNMTWSAVAPFSNDDWVFIEGVVGMTELNGNTYRLAAVTATTANLLDVYGNSVDSTGFSPYLTGGTVSRIYTLATPYSENDLAYLKFTQSADVMTICCVNQETGTEYKPQDLSRLSDTSWSFADVVANPTIAAPTTVTGSISDPNGNTFYAYEVTAVSPLDGTESIASPIARTKGVSIATTANAQGNILWSAVATVQQYNIYKAQISDLQDVPGGSLFGLIGSAYGNQFVDRDYNPDFSTVPPRHKNPFAPGLITSVKVVSQGSGYSQTTAAVTITTGTGTGAKLTPIVQTGKIVAIIVEDAGQNYRSTDVVHITGGTGATATLNIGPLTGTYPSVPGYFQQRRVFAGSLNNPDTYWMSQPGSYTNFDTRLPTVDSDAITGSPWAVQVDGIQALVQTTAGFLVMTGQSAWMLVGQGSFANNVQAISPDSQVANPLPFTGCSATIPPQKILFDVLYATPKGDVIYQLPYQGYAFTEPIDLTEYASHLFVGYTIEEWAWCSQPYKLDWVVRNDGVALALTYLKAEQVNGWSRHDTQGYFRSVCSVIEPPVQAPYFVVERYPGGKKTYMIERMDNRIWPSVEDAWCVDSGLSLGQPTPPGTLSASTPYGLGAISGAAVVDGGSGYSNAATGQVIDQELGGDNNPIGWGATVRLTIAAGVITAVTVLTAGSNYRRPKLNITDPQAPGGGTTDPAQVTLILNNAATFTSSSPAFTLSDVGKVIRMGGGVATITAYTNSGQVTANITTPIAAIAPNIGGGPTVEPQATGDWTMTQPVASVGGALHLAGATVTGLADGVVIAPRTVNDDGTIDLDAPASAVVIGLGFQTQVQTVPIDVGSPTVQGQRKVVAAVSAQVQDSRSVLLGQSQQDGSTLSPPQIAPVWGGMQATDDLLSAPYDSVTIPLFTGWVRTPVEGGWSKEGQIAVQQDLPLPLNVISLVAELLTGDTPGQTVPKTGSGNSGKAASA